MNLLNKKRGMSKLQSFIIHLLLAIVIFISLMVFVNNISSGKLIEEQVLAKQIALLIDSSKPGSEIIINVQDFLVDISGNDVEVISEGGNIGYSYKFFTTPNVVSERKDNNIILKIS